MNLKNVAIATSLTLSATALSVGAQAAEQKSLAKNTDCVW